MSQFPSFVSGIELTSLVASSNLLGFSWEAIQAAGQEQATHQLPVRLKIIECSNCIIAVFVTSTTAHDLLQENGRALVSSDTLRQANFLHFEFLLSKRNPSVSIHQGAVKLFIQCLDQLSKVKAEWVDQKSGKLLNNTTLIITGLALGGWVASLFTLWLLDSIDWKSPKLPLCVTFGSPLLGDQNLQQAISDFSRWNSCFLHVACAQDPVPRMFTLPEPHQVVASSSQINHYKPFGTFLFCSILGSACTEDPVVALKLLVESSRSLDLGRGMHDDLYGTMIEQINSGVYRRGSMQNDMLVSGLREIGLIILMEAAGIRVTQDQQQQSFNDILAKLEEREWEIVQKNLMDPSRKLNEVKKKMACLERYKKLGKERGMGYYDSYKNRSLDKRDNDATIWRKFLTKYWDEVVMDAARKPQKEGANVRMVWLYAGKNYRRMVEPLEIAEYYRDNKRDYENQGRPEHFKLLEKWEMEDPDRSETILTERKKQNVCNTLTEDPLFWARVEEATICCRIPMNAGSSRYLHGFVEYVMGEIDKYALSPEVFLAGSSFMSWWNKFEEIIGHPGISSNYNSNFLRFMQQAKYRDYEIGRYHP